MTHISKRRLKQKDFNLLYFKFHNIIAKLDADTSRGFFDELLSEAEKIMLTKRISAIIMFKEGYSIYRVSQILLISPSTAERIKLKHEIGAYRYITRILNKQTRSYKEFWSALEVILRAGMPPMGKGRWKNIMKS